MRVQFLNAVWRSITQQADTTPNRIAIHDGITYRALCDNSCAIARSLSDLNIRPGNRVALLMEHAPAAYAPVYGILLSGCTYVPLSADDPPSRLQDMLNDAEVSALISSVGCATLAEQLIERVPRKIPLLVAGKMEQPTRSASGTEEMRRDGNVPVYLLYTSGSNLKASPSRKRT
jgi:acyl-CoA synthetase (AMP-forming)/AMP-acid ligase II